VGQKSLLRKETIRGMSWVIHLICRNLKPHLKKLIFSDDSSSALHFRIQPCSHSGHSSQVQQGT
jgi:hypothetical protein